MNTFKIYTATFILCSGFVGSLSATESHTASERRITVQGQGKISAVPDQARIQVMVTEDGPKVDSVTAQVRQKMDAVLKVIKGQGIADKDIQTQYYRVSPKMEWRNGRSNRVGYTVSNQVEVKIHDLKKTGTLLSAVQDAGANDISGPQFEFENPRDLERKALAQALLDAKAKAALLAETAGATLGDVQTIDEGASFRPSPRPMIPMRAMSAAAPAEEPIAAGEETIQANITASFALK
jgi:uncharacterized protein YggE